MAPVTKHASDDPLAAALPPQDLKLGFSKTLSWRDPAGLLVASLDGAV